MPKTANRPVADACPCGSGYPLQSCCLPYLAGLAQAATALALMRSRYTAHVLGTARYLSDTWHPRTRPPRMDLDPGRRWLGLRILDSAAGQAGDTQGTVEFVARFKVAGRAHRLRERSRFVCEDGRWYYVDGEVDGARA